MPLSLKKILLVCCVFFFAHTLFAAKPDVRFNYLLFNTSGEQVFTDGSVDALKKLADGGTLSTQEKEKIRRINAPGKQITRTDDFEEIQRALPKKEVVIASYNRRMGITTPTSGEIAARVEAARAGLYAPAGTPPKRTTITQEDRTNFRYLLFDSAGKKIYSDDSIDALIKLKRMDRTNFLGVQAPAITELAGSIKREGARDSLKSADIDDLHSRISILKKADVERAIADKATRLQASREESARAREAALESVSAEDRARAEKIRAVNTSVRSGYLVSDRSDVDRRRATRDGEPFDYAGFQDLLFDESGNQMFTEDSLPHLVKLYRLKDSHRAMPRDEYAQIEYLPDYPAEKKLSDIQTTLNRSERRLQIQQKIKSLEDLTAPPSSRSPSLSPVLPVVAVTTPTPRVMTARRPSVVASGMDTGPFTGHVERLGTASLSFQSDVSRAAGLSTHQFNRTDDEARRALDNTLGRQATELEKLRRQVADLEQKLAASESRRIDLELEMAPLRERATINTKAQADLKRALEEITHLKQQLAEMSSSSGKADEHLKTSRRLRIEIEAVKKERDEAKAAAKKTDGLEATIKRLTDEAAAARRAAEDAQRQFTMDLEASKRSVDKLTSTTQRQEAELVQLRKQVEEDRATIENLRRETAQIREEHTAAVIKTQSEHEAQVSAAVEAKRAAMQRDIETQKHKATASDEAARAAKQRASELEAEATRLRARASAADDAERRVRSLTSELSSATSQVATLKEQLAARTGTESEELDRLRRQLSAAEERAGTARKELEDQAAAHRRAFDAQAETNREALEVEAAKTRAAESRASGAESRVSSAEDAAQRARRELAEQKDELLRLRQIAAEIGSLKAAAATHTEQKESAERSAGRIAELEAQLATQIRDRKSEKAHLEAARQATQEARDEAEAAQLQFNQERKDTDARHAEETADLRRQLQQAQEDQRHAEAQARVVATPVDRVVERIVPGPADTEALRALESQLDAERREKTEAIREAQRRADEATREAQRRSDAEIATARARVDAELLRAQGQYESQVRDLQAAQALELERMRSAVSEAGARSREAIERASREKDSEIARVRETQLVERQQLELAKTQEIARLEASTAETIRRLREDQLRERAALERDTDTRIAELTRAKDGQIRATEQLLSSEKEQTSQLLANSLARGADGGARSPRGRASDRGGDDGFSDGRGDDRHPPVSVVVNPTPAPNINIHVDAPHITLPAAMPSPIADQTLLIQSLQERLHAKDLELEREKSRMTLEHRERISELERTRQDAQRLQEQALEDAREASRGFERQITQIQADARVAQATSVAENRALTERLAAIQAQKDAADRDVIRLTAESAAKDVDTERLRGELSTEAERHRGEIKSAQSKARRERDARKKAQRLREVAEGERDVMRQRAQALEVDYAHLAAEFRIQQNALRQAEQVAARELQDKLAFAQAFEEARRAAEESTQRAATLENTLRQMEADNSSMKEEASTLRQQLEAAGMEADNARDEATRLTQQLAEKDLALKAATSEKDTLIARAQAAQEEAEAARGRLSKADPAAGLRAARASLADATTQTAPEAREEEFKKTVRGSYGLWTIPFPRTGGKMPTLSSNGRLAIKRQGGSPGDNSGPSSASSTPRSLSPRSPLGPLALKPKDTSSLRSRFTPAFKPQPARKPGNPERAKELLAGVQADADRNERMFKRIRARQAEIERKVKAQQEASAAQEVTEKTLSDKDSLQARINEMAKRLAADDASLDATVDRPGTRPEEVVYTYTRRQVLVDQLKGLQASYLRAFGSDDFIANSQSLARQHEEKIARAQHRTTKGTLGSAAAAKISEKRTPKTSSRALLHHSPERKPLGDAFRAHASARAARHQ